MRRNGRCTRTALEHGGSTNMRNYRTLLAFIAVAALMVLSAVAAAQNSIDDTSATASVDVQPALSLSLIASPSWGQVVRPTAGSAQYKLDYSSGAVTVVSGLGYAFDNGHFGEYTLSGAPNAPVAYTVAIGAFSGSGVTVIAAHINGTASSGTGTLD